MSDLLYHHYSTVENTAFLWGHKVSLVFHVLLACIEFCVFDRAVISSKFYKLVLVGEKPLLMGGFEDTNWAECDDSRSTKGPVSM